jgi:F0F1-type ATP synthase assembly protein I
MLASERCLGEGIMPKKSESFIQAANESMQKNLDRAEPVIFAAYGVIGAILLLGGGGYALDRWLGTQPWFLLAGVVVGLCVAFYSLSRVVRSR